MSAHHRRLIPAGLVVVVVALLAIQFAPGLMPGTATQAPPAATPAAAAPATDTPATDASATVSTDEETAAGGGEDRDAPGGASLHSTAPAPKMYTGDSKPVVQRHPNQLVLKAARSRVFDVRTLPKGKIIRLERNEVEPPRGDADATDPEAPAPGPDATDPDAETPTSVDPNAMVKIPANSALAPAPTSSFAGLDFAGFGAGHPPDTNGDVGPTYYIQTINSSIGIYDKSSGTRVAAFTFNTFMSQGTFGNLCDTNNFGDPVVLYDSFENRWVITDFAFQLSGGSVVNPPGSFECVAVSKTGDPVTGGWNYYSVNTTGGLGDYPKFGVWPDGIYWSANMFGYASGAPFQNPRVYAMNKAQMYAGEPTAQILTFDAPADDFSLVPSNARLQTGTPPTGTPDYFVSTWDFTNAVNVYSFHVDWTHPSSSTFSGPFTQLAATSWPDATVPNAPSQSGNALDVLQIRAMMQNQYTNIGSAESLWAVHTVRRADTSGFAAPRYYQLNVSGGTVAANAPQAATWDPDGANVMYRFMPSLAVDRLGDMAMGYSTSSSSTKPAIKYAGRLATDPANTFSQTEQTLIQGTGTQTGNCGSSACIRWGDYSAMTLDPDGCTFWYTNQYYAVDGLDYQTQIGSFSYPGCTLAVDPATGTYGGTATLSATLTASSTGLGGKTVAFTLNGNGVGSATTNGSGVATLPGVSLTGIDAGSYPTGVGATFAGDSGNGPSSNTASLSIDKAAATLTLDAGSLNQNYDGTPKSVTVTSTPPGLSGISVTYDGSPTPPSAAGSYPVSATLSNTNYQASPATGTLVIGSFARSGSTITVSAVRVSLNSGIQFSDTVLLRATVTGSVAGRHVKGTVIFRVNGNPGAGIAVAVDGTSPVTVYTPLQLSSAIIPAGAGKYRLSARFSPSAGSDYNGSRTKHMQIVRQEGVNRNGVLDGSTRLVYTGPTSVVQGVNPIVSANLLQSQGSASADHEYVDFSGGAVKVVFRVYRTNCASCPTGPVYVSAPTSVVNSPTWATTGTGTASVKAPRHLAPGTYKVTITRVANRYLSVKTVLASLSIT